MLSAQQIQNIIPHRYPFMLIDKIIELEKGKKAIGIKNVSMNEWFFQGHFPENPIMPGVLIVEALAQVACVAGATMEGCENKLGVFTSLDSIKFKKQVLPGDVLRLEATITAFKLNIGKAEIKAYVDDKLVTVGKIGFAMVNRS